TLLRYLKMFRARAQARTFACRISVSDSSEAHRKQAGADTFRVWNTGSKDWTYRKQKRIHPKMPRIGILTDNRRCKGVSPQVPANSTNWTDYSRFGAVAICFDPPFRFLWPINMVL